MVTISNYRHLYTKIGLENNESCDWSIFGCQAFSGSRPKIEMKIHTFDLGLKGYPAASGGGSFRSTGIESSLPDTTDKVRTTLNRTRPPSSLYV